MTTSGDIGIEASALNNPEKFEEHLEPLRCWDCNLNFTSTELLYNHLVRHIKQPQVKLTRCQLPPLKITIKTNRAGNNYEIINSPTDCGSVSPLSDHTKSNLAAEIDNANKSCDKKFDIDDNGIKEQRHDDEQQDDALEEAEVSEYEEDVALSPAADDSSGKPTQDPLEVQDGGSIPGAEPTPPPEASPDYPKIRIKTTGLLKESLTITEITDDSPENSSEAPDNGKKDHLWGNSAEDPLKLPGSDDILSLFNNNERAKDFGFTTSDSEFIPMDRLEDRNRNAMQIYNPSQMNPNAINSLAGLPMEALAQQVSRLQPSSNGMHQQNVLINIQQFPQPPQPQYQPPPMYHHPPQPPMYHQPYQPYQPPPPPIYFPPAYPSQHMPPPPQIVQPPPPPPLSQPRMVQQPPTSQAQPSYNRPQMRPAGPSRQMAPRMISGNNAPRQPMGARQQPPMRVRAPMVRPRGMTAVRSVRPRMSIPHSNQIRPQQAGVKRGVVDQQTLQAKKKRFDVLTPDKDDEDCQVICMQPKNTDGGLPQIQSVQGGPGEAAESSIMHLSDSITLSVRNPQPRPPSPKKSDAKAVANILATRGITVTATPKPKEKIEAQKGPSIPASLNLNGAVSIIPSAKATNNKTHSSGQESHLPTVDLTDDTTSSSQATIKPPPSTPNKTSQRQGLPFKCDLCPAQYPNAMGLSKHRQNYHKTSSGMCDIGVPLINLKQPGIFQKLSSLGIYNYIPLPASGPDGLFALPIINGRNPGNVGALGATTMLTLGPVRSIPRPQTQNNKQINNHK